MQKKKSISFLVLIVFLFQMFFISSGEINSESSSNIDITINGEKLDTDVSAFIKDNRTMAPFRVVFEKLGAKVSWDSATKSVVGIRNNTVIKLFIGSDIMSVNGFNIKLDTKIFIKEGRTFIPVRFIAESLGAEVNWNAKERVVNISHKLNNISLIDIKLDESKEIITSNYKEEYARVKVDNNSCTVYGRVKDEIKKKYILININNKSDNKTLEKYIAEVDSNGNFSAKLNLSKLTNNKNYLVYIYSSSQKYDKSYVGWIYNKNVILTKQEGEVYIKKPKPYDLNISNYLKNIKSPSEYLKAEKYIESDNEEIVKLANELIDGKVTDLEKIVAIHDWIVENIYYDYDIYASGNLTWEETSAVNVLKTKKSVCQGYANLFQALSRASKIPCFTDVGFALGVSQNGNDWDSIDLNKIDSNHAWNVIYVENKWIIVDSTWDSGNKYENGKFIYAGSRGYKYFDPSMYLFSSSHYIIN